MDIAFNGHRILLKHCLAPIPVPWAGHVPFDRLLKTPSSLTLTTSRGRASTASLGNLF